LTKLVTLALGNRPAGPALAKAKQLAAERSRSGGSGVSSSGGAGGASSAAGSASSAAVSGAAGTASGPAHVYYDPLNFQTMLLEPFHDLFRSKYEDTREHILEGESRMNSPWIH
jgi:hypothetical protein